MLTLSTLSALDEQFEALVPPCSDAPEQFFSEVPTDLEQAKVVCRVCPIRSSCLEGAVERREPWGVWGGELFERGRVVTRKRGPGRPRKEAFVETVVPVVIVPGQRQSESSDSKELVSAGNGAAA